MTRFSGQNPDEVEALATQLDARAIDIDSLISTLTERVHDTTWVGAERTRFEGEWTGPIATTLHEVADSLRDAAENARSNANEQRGRLAPVSVD